MAPKFITCSRKELVPGDIVELRAGDKVPADMQVLDLITSTLEAEQGSLTGESGAVNKTNKMVDADIQGKKCMVFGGTTVVNGTCICLVIHIGMGTEIGKVHEQIHVASQSEEDTPKKKLNEFGETLTKTIGVACVLVWVINVKYFFSWKYVDGWPQVLSFHLRNARITLKIAVALAVAAIPEGLPAVITTCLALGTGEMAKKNALVRKLPSVETLGCTTVICSDKTGMLTTNQMAVIKLVGMGNTSNELRSFKVDGTTYSPFDGKIQDPISANLEMIAKIAALCIDASILESGGKYVAHGMPTEAALQFEKMSLPKERNDGLLLSSSYTLNRKFMGVIVKSQSGERTLLVKGAVENLLERSTAVQLHDGSIVKLTENTKANFAQMLLEMSTSALRCLGFTYKDEDPPREEISQSIKDCRATGIRAIVITGDNKNTVEGDGVNDAPALKLADIGIAMGITCIEVAKEKSDMVLADDNFSTIVVAVGEGRSIYNYMKAFIRYMISSNTDEVVSIFLASALGIPEGLTPVQLLWINLLTDGPPTTALGFNPLARSIMKKQPRHSNDHLIITWTLFRYLVIGSYVGLATVGIFVIWYTHNPFLGNDLSGDGRSLVTYSQLGKALSFERNSCAYFKHGKVKATTLPLSLPLGLNEWILVLVVASPVIVIDEALKFVGRHAGSFSECWFMIGKKPMSDKDYENGRNS
ncbi:hypothetical protein BUALT_Bualt09G0067700 [Buddleja alternifolia]|uniref:Calcium-transporting ATPase n=1 Tax=Buddleja alternifolia TaxID=168488 RepID=A0AAV6XBC4_9LAMI|nr:hypothetical protein BUALT_Bualt09G0067700 [Buddleja alternifolia]